MRRVCAVVSAVALGSVAAVGLPTIASAAGTDHYIYRTDGDGVIIYTEASLSSTNLGVLADGATFVPDCWTRSDWVENDPVWLHGTAGSLTGWVTDYYVDTHWTTTSDLVAQGIPECGTQCTASQKPEFSSGGAWPGSTSPVNIQLKVNGTRERNLQALTPVLQAAADAAGVDGQELARVIDHEGGNYLDSAWRRDGWEQVEEGWPYPNPSVGIGQMKVSTARMVDAQVYGADDSGVDDKAMRSRLIHDQKFAMFMAAGYLRIMQDMVRFYRSGLSIAEVGRLLGCSARTVERRLNCRGVQRRDTHGRSRS